MIQILFIIIQIIVTVSSQNCGNGTYLVNSKCLSSCGDKIRAGNEICDGGVGCELNCQCAKGWKGNNSTGCVPTEKEITVGFTFVLEMDKQPGYMEALFKYEIEGQIKDAYKYQFWKDKKNVKIDNDKTKVKVKSFKRETLKNTSIPVEFCIQESNENLPTYVEFFEKMITDRDSGWYLQNATILKYTNLLKEPTIIYGVELDQYDGGKLICMLMILILLVFI